MANCKPEQLPQILTVKQLCERWQCAQHTVLSAISSGRLRAFPLKPEAKRPTWRIPVDAVRDFESGGPKVEPTKPQRRRRPIVNTHRYF